MMSVDNTANVSYVGAASHYLSPNRRDPVKRLWEEPFSRSVLVRAVESLQLEPEAPIRVVDIGAGIGDGLDLLESALESANNRSDLRKRPVTYVGIDIDGEMITTAREVHGHRPDAQFIQADVREFVPGSSADLYISAGVPYSHFTEDELTDVLSNIFAVVRKTSSRATVVVDVLGRYSREWEPCWDQSRWEYNMSFFQDTDDVITTPMTFHSRSSLATIITTGAERGGVRIRGIEYFDRSVAVGRHTATGAFNPQLPPYRTLVNSLFQRDTKIDINNLMMEPPAQHAPEEVESFFAHFIGAWNTRITEAAHQEDKLGVAPWERWNLARDLCQLEQSSQRGLGVGHSLIAVVMVEGSAEVENLPSDEHDST